MPRVFLIEKCKPGIDVDKARSYGDLVYAFNPEDRRSSVFRPDRFIDEVLERFKNAGFDPATDYFCLAGSTVPLTLVTAGLLDVYGHLRLLMFSGNDCKYVEKSIRSRHISAA